MIQWWGKRSGFAMCIPLYKITTKYDGCFRPSLWQRVVSHNTIWLTNFDICLQKPYILVLGSHYTSKGHGIFPGKLFSCIRWNQEIMKENHVRSRLLQRCCSTYSKSVHTGNCLYLMAEVLAGDSSCRYQATRARAPSGSAQLCLAAVFPERCISRERHWLLKGQCR